MKKALVPLADGFEDIEAVSIIDVLRRGGVNVVTASLSDGTAVRSAHGIRMEADARLPDVLAPRTASGWRPTHGSPTC